MAPASCSVCVEAFNKSTRKAVKCVHCAFEACLGCCKRFICTPDSPNEPACMSCAKPWNSDFIADFFPKKFVNDDLKKHRQQQLYQREVAMMPATQPLVERLMQAKKLEQQRDALIEERTQLKARLAAIVGELVQADNAIYRARNRCNTDQAFAQKERRQFTRKCTHDECRGFLSTAWKCGLCENYTCPDCHDVVGKERPSAEGEDGVKKHVCKPENVETAKLLARDSKPCPGCHVLIHKIEGCSQMFCTLCHVLFDWNTLKIETGRAHNPHAIAWMREQSGGAAGPRPVGDMPCGGLPSQREVMNALKRVGLEIRNVGGFDLGEFLRWVTHVYEVDRRRYVVDNLMDTVDLRCNWMIHDLTNEEFMQKLQRREKDRMKRREIEEVLAALFTVAGDIVRNMVGTPSGPSAGDVHESVAQLKRLVAFATEGMARVAKKYDCKVPSVAFPQPVKAAA